LAAEQDEACRDSIERMQATGAPILSDGEQRASSFATYPLTDTLAGTGLAENLAADGQYFAIFADGHSPAASAIDPRTVPVQDVRRGICGEGEKGANKPLKQAVIAPSMLALLRWMGKWKDIRARSF
jgi:hypothetical protein